ncbi:CLUMA_CG020864, isoform A [Clunio marinus]|uniref:Protein hunchback n=1 Tax=Clunio marinus TaxID=568069 RepID=A0A1J1J9E5_9DIPT|nr:CLUMA_CG020864, isoform A [Clunio marinus]
MHQSWESSALNSVGSTALMPNNFEQHQKTMWINQTSKQIKTEKMECCQYIQPASSQNLSPTLPQSTLDLLEQMPAFRKFGAFNPLTPPGYSENMFGNFIENPINSKEKTPSKAQDLSKSRSSSLEIENASITPPIDVTPPKSPSQIHQTPEKSGKNVTRLGRRSESIESYDDDSFSEDDESCEDLTNNKKRKSGNTKPRQYKCKQCKQLFFSKREFWDHTRTHIKPEKMLQCPKCAFVTEYKHHLEYHLRNHSRLKPFACPHCNYSCVNKSMLNSHLKSHSTVLQYRCLDCNYATKYCHSLKLHLRKYSHKPDIVLNLDGTPNPLPIIDVYGTRRGPKSKSTTSKLLAEIEKNQQAQHQAQKSQLSPPLTPSSSSFQTTTTNSITKTPPSSMLPNAAMMVNMLQNKLPLFPYFNLNFQMFAAQQQNQLQQNEKLHHDEHKDDEFSSETKPSPKKLNVERKVGRKTKRKGKAFKFDEKMNSHIDLQDEMEDYTYDENLSTSRIAKLNNDISVKTDSQLNSIDITYDDKESDYECKFCGIIFKDNVLFSLHSGYHSVGEDPFKCNMCGTKTDDKVQFFLHIAKFPHS